MLTSENANHLIKRFEKSTKYRIAIIDSKGIIIASREKDRIGAFHTQAYHLMTNGQPELVCADGLDGEEGGVILPVSLEDTVVGAVEMLGPPEQVQEPAQLLKVAVEEVLEAQARCNGQFRQSTLSGRFYEQLLTASADLSHLEVRARMLGYNVDCPRISIMIVPLKEQYQDLVEKLVREGENTSHQEIIMRPAGVQTLVFFQLKTVPHLCGNYREQVEGYLSPILAQMDKQGIQYKCIVGSIQNQLDRYHISFQHCMWMSKNASRRYPPNSTAYLYDHVREYLLSRIDPDELSGMFEAYTQYEPESFWEDYIPIVSTMNRYQNNMIKSSEVLHMHKNTLAYRYKQIRAQLALDPLQSAADDDFTAELCYYLQKK